ncbi:MAG: hypothetical protein HQL31_01635, partial [Planctomycetes bacterium]|nr:hypothetical protein [Planctomycetota bacterium]
GVVHRDLKPSNIMVGAFGEVAVLDWGLAKTVGESSAVETGDLAKEVGGGVNRSVPETLRTDRDMAVDTLTGKVMGSPHFMAPEQALGKTDVIDARTDIFALGRIFFNILTLKKPFHGKSMKVIIENLNSSEGFGIREIKEAEEDLEARSSRAGVLPHIPGRKVPDALARICIKAMEHDHRERYSSVKKMQEDIEAYQSGNLTSVESSGLFKIIYLLYRRRRGEFLASVGVFLLLLVFSGMLFLQRNERERLELQARILYHRQQEELLTEQKMRMDAEEKKAEEEQRRIRQKFLQEQEQRREWHLVLEEDFSASSVLSRWNVGGEGKIGWEIVEGRFDVWGDRFHHLSSRKEISGDVDLEFDALLPDGGVGEFGCFLNCMSEARLGYRFRIRVGAHSSAFIERGSGPPLSTFVLAGGNISTLKGGEAHRIRANRVDRRLSLHIDGSLVLEVNDTTLPIDENLGGIGLYGDSLRVGFDNIRISRQGVPVRADLLVVATDFLKRNEYKLAERLFREVLFASRKNPQRKAMAERGLDICRDTALLEKRIPIHWPGIEVSIYLNDLESFTMESLDPQIGRLDEVLEGISLNYLSLNQTGVKDLGVLAGMPLRYLSLDNTPVNSLEPLRGLPLRKLSLAGTRVEDIEPLAGGKLEDLDLTGTRVVELRSLAGLPLKVLRLDYTEVSELQPLQGMKLKELGISGTRVGDLSVLEGMALRKLELSGSQVSSLAPLSGMPLDSLNVSRTMVADLGPLAGMPLESLNLRYSRVVELAPLAGMPLRVLNIDETGVEEIGVVATLGELEYLDLGQKVRDLQALSGRRLKSLSLLGNRKILVFPALEGTSIGELLISDTLFEDLSGLAQVEFEVLRVIRTPVKSLDCLAGKKLRCLQLAKTALENFDFLRKMQLESLSLNGEGIDSLACIAELKLLDLSIKDTAVDNLYPLESMALEQFHFSPSSIRHGLYIMRQKSSLRIINDYPTERFWKLFDSGVFR